jgi:chemotaxis protein CheC
MQKSILKEYVNVFIGQAANMLSEMTNQRVLLSVQELEVIDMNDENATNGKTFFEHGHIVSSSIRFGQDFSGRAYLIFPANKAKQLVDVCLGTHFENTGVDFNKELTDTDFDVLKEISNVILNSVVGEFSNLLGTKVDFGIPDVELIFVSENEQISHLKNNVYMLMFFTSFKMEMAEIKGVVVIALGMHSLNMVVDKINEIIGEMNE